MIALMPRAYIIELLTDLFKARRRPKYGSSEHFWATLQWLIDNPSPHERYVAPWGGTMGDREHGLYPDTPTDAGGNPFAQATRLKEARERERVYGWDKLERPASIIEP